MPQPSPAPTPAPPSSMVPQSHVSGEADRTRPEISVVAPAHNEEANVRALVDEVGAAMTAVGVPFEFIVVDDGSTDATRARVFDLMRDRPWLRCVAMTRTPPGKGGGQSAAFSAGIQEARGRLIATLDADLQNDPKDLVRMHQLILSADTDMVQGDRSHNRKDNAFRRVQSAIGRWFRRSLLGDTIRDTGCSLRLFKREIGVQLPLTLRGMHRFIPVTARHLGYRVVEMPVNHRPRTAGETKYGMGVAKRAIPGLIDLFAVRYMKNRRRPVDHAEITLHSPPHAHQAQKPDQPDVVVSSRGVRQSARSAAGAQA